MALNAAKGRERHGRSTRASVPWVRYALLTAGACLMIYPVVWMLAAALSPAERIFSGVWPLRWPLDSYGFKSGWSALGPSFALFFLNSFIICGIAVVGNLISCSVAAYAFARLRFAFRRTLFATLLMTLMLPIHVLIVPQYVLFKLLGWVNTFLPLIVPKFFAVDAFFVFLLIQFIRTIPRELDEAAAIDGCGPFGTYWRVVLPLAKPALATTAVFTFIFTYNDFLSQLLYLSNVNNFTVALALRQFVDSTSLSNYNGLFAMSILALLPVLGFFVAFQRLLVSGIATTGFR